MPLMSRNSAGVVLVTGSSGLIGRAVVRRLAQQFVMVGFDREGWPNPPPEAECVCVDLTSDESVDAAFARVRYAYGDEIASVVHLAAYYDFSGEPSPLYDELTVRGTGRLLHALKAFDVAQFVFSSTMLVHAPCEPGERIDEDWPLDPKWDYPRSKVATEDLIWRERGVMPAVRLRIAGVYDDDCRSLPLANQIQRIFERRLTSHVFPGDLSRGQAFVHLDDVVEAIVKTVDARLQLSPDATFLIGEPGTLSYDDLQRAFATLIHGEEEWETRSIPKALAKTGAWLEDLVPGEEPFIKPWMIDLADDHYALDIGRARQILGWEPHRTLRETLPLMVSALKADPVRFYKTNKLEVPSWLEHTVTSEGMTRQAPDETAHAEAHDHDRMLRDMRAPWLWTNGMVILLGLWLISSPWTFDYRSAAMTWSDMVSGALLVGLATAAFVPRYDFYGRWSVALVGTWLQFAPLVFWAPTAAAYLNDTIVGAFAIALSILVPMMPGMAHHMAMTQPGPEIPPGWTYNPSTWHQRAPMIGLGFLGWLISRYLAAYQLGYITQVWEPFFGEGTVRVLTSEMSKMWPISDAGLGATAYTFEMLMAWMGGKTRWRSMPWMVTFFFILVVPLGLTHIVLVISQPVVVGEWCTLCLAAAGVMLAMIPFTIDEVFAMGQFMAERVRAGKPFWWTFFVGDTTEGGGPDQRTATYGAPLVRQLPASVWGVTLPPTLILSGALGIWFMFAPAILGSTGTAANSDRLVGALVLTVAAISTAEVVRAFRFVNTLCGVWLVVAPWALMGTTPSASWNGVIGGVVLLALTWPRGQVRERYAAWDRWVV